MNKSLLSALHQRRPEIRARWETLLRVEPVSTPLANPDTLVFMFDQTLDEVLGALPERMAGPIRPRTRPTSQCDCNPMRAYFLSLEQALMETLVLIQAGLPALGPDERVASVTELCSTLRRIARREMAVFDVICQQAVRGIKAVEQHELSFSQCGKRPG